MRELVCPFCGHRAEAFKGFGIDQPVLSELQVIGGGRRDNALCPQCGSIDRERLMLLYLRHRTDCFSAAGSILHVGPEQCLRREIAEQHQGEYLTADLLRDDVDMNLDLTVLAFPDRRFDLILCAHVLEHIPDDAAAMAELHRVLKPGGLALLQVPMSLRLEQTLEDPAADGDAERLRRFGQEDHVRIYAGDYVQRLQRAGFQVEVFDWTQQEDAEQWRAHGLIEAEKFYVGKKPSEADRVDSGLQAQAVTLG